MFWLFSQTSKITYCLQKKNMPMPELHTAPALSPFAAFLGERAPLELARVKENKLRKKFWNSNNLISLASLCSQWWNLMDPYHGSCMDPHVWFWWIHVTDPGGNTWWILVYPCDSSWWILHPCGGSVGSWLSHWCIKVNPADGSWCILMDPRDGSW